MPKISQIVIAPRWAGSPKSDWYPEFLKRFESKVQIKIMDPPNMSAPKIDECIKYLQKELESQDLSSTLLIGHSVGNQIILRFLEKEKENQNVPCFLAVAGWFEVDQIWETLLPWLEPFDYSKSSKQILKTKLLISDNDPYTSDFKKNKELWENRLGAEVTISENGKHFNGIEELKVFEIVEEILNKNNL